MLRGRLPFNKSHPILNQFPAHRIVPILIDGEYDLGGVGELLHECRYGMKVPNSGSTSRNHKHVDSVVALGYCHAFTSHHCATVHNRTQQQDGSQIRILWACPIGG